MAGAGEKGRGIREEVFPACPCRLGRSLHFIGWASGTPEGSDEGECGLPSFCKAHPRADWREREGRCLQRQASVLPCARQTSGRLLRPRVLRVTEATHASRHCRAGYMSARARVNAMLFPVRPSLSLLVGITQDPGNPDFRHCLSSLYHGGKKSSTLIGQGDLSFVPRAMLLVPCSRNPSFLALRS